MRSGDFTAGHALQLVACVLLWYWPPGHYEIGIEGIDGSKSFIKHEEYSFKERLH